MPCVPRNEDPVETVRRLLRGPLLGAVIIGALGLVGFDISGAARMEFPGHADMAWQAMLCAGGLAGFLVPVLPWSISQVSRTAVEAAGYALVALAAAIFVVVVISVNGILATAAAGAASCASWVFGAQAIRLWWRLATALILQAEGESRS